jgi:hypothetical protein
VNADGFSFSAEIIHWRGPAPFFFVPVPGALAESLRRQAARASYGWGVVPVAVQIGEVAFTTSLFPKDRSYLLPLKNTVRAALAVTSGDTVSVEMRVVSKA